MTFLETAALAALLQIAVPPDPPAGSVSTAAARPAAQDQEAPGSTGGWNFRLMPGPSLRFRDIVRLDFRARLRLDTADSPVLDDDDGESRFDVGRRRLEVGGELWNVVQFEIEHELGSDEAWRDVYFDYRQFDAVRVQAGQFKLPFCLDENTGSTNLDFTHRSRIATHLAPGRDRGIMLHGRPFTRVLRYEIGLFDQDGRNARTNNLERVHGGRTVAGRLTVQPFGDRKSELADLRTGFAFTTSPLPEGFPALRGETALEGRFFRGEVWVNGRRRRTGVEFRWRPGPFSIQSEYIRSADERRGQSVENTDLSPLVGAGWYISGTWLLTGERKAGLDDPIRPLLPKLGTGAIELAGRFETLTFRSAGDDEPPSTSARANVIVGNALRSTTFGANWYLNRWIKVQANFIRDRIEDPAQGPLLDRAVFWSRVVLVQFAL